MTFRMTALTLGMSIALALPTLAAEHEVLMLNSGETGRMVFEPAFLEIAVGDTVTFVTTDPGHNAESIKDLIPEGAVPFKGALNETISVTFDVAGAYAYKCAPHLGMGMVGLIVVGEDPGNLDAIAAANLPPKAKTLYEQWLTELSE